MIEFSKRNKDRLVAATAVATAIIGGVAVAHAADSDGKEPSSYSNTHESNRDLILPVTGIDTVGGTDSGWEQGAAERALEKAVKKAFKMLDMADQIDEVSLYESAQKAVEMARRDGIVPDEGDQIEVFVDVRKTPDGKISIEVTGAEYPQ